MLNYVIKGFGNQMAFGAPWLTYRLPRSESLGRMDHGGCFLFISVLVSQCFSSFPFLSSSQKPHCRTLSCGNWLSKREASFFRDLCWTLGTPPLKHPWGSEVGARWCCLLLHMVPPLGLHPPQLFPVVLPAVSCIRCVSLTFLSTSGCPQSIFRLFEFIINLPKAMWYAFSE